MVALKKVVSNVRRKLLILESCQSNISLHGINVNNLEISLVKQDAQLKVSHFIFEIRDRGMQRR